MAGRQEAAIRRGIRAPAVTGRPRGRRAHTLAAAGAIMCLAVLLPGASRLGSPVASLLRPGTRDSAAARAARAPLPEGLASVASSTISLASPRLGPVRHGAWLRTGGDGIQAAYTSGGVILHTATAAMGLSLEGVGRGGRVNPLVPVAPVALGGQVVYRHGSLSETYTAGPFGIEQAFTVRSRPTGAAGPLVLAMRLRGGVPAGAGTGGALLRSDRGAATLHYGALSAIDASGRRLPGRVAIVAGKLELRIDDSGARYPLRIDPFVEQGPKRVLPEEVGSGEAGYAVALSGDGNTAVIGGPADAGHVGAVWVFVRAGGKWTQQGPKLIGTAMGEGEEEPGEEEAEHFGASVAISGDGSTVLVGSPVDSAGVGAAWVFVREENEWTQQGPKLTAHEERGPGRFGRSVALSSDGNTALIGGSGDGLKGAAWAFTRAGSTWTQQGPKLTGAAEVGEGHFGAGVALSGDGNEALVGGPGDSGFKGAAWMFMRTGSTWLATPGKLSGGEEVGEGRFGRSVALSADGDTALIGGRTDDGGFGAAWLFARSGSTWAQQAAKLAPTTEGGQGHFGQSVSLSGEGSTAIVGAPLYNDSIGSAFVYTREGTTWSLLGEPLTGQGEEGMADLGASVSVSADGQTALVGGPLDAAKLGATWTYVFRSSQLEREEAEQEHDEQQRQRDEERELREEGRRLGEQERNQREEERGRHEEHGHVVSTPIVQPPISPASGLPASGTLPFGAAQPPAACHVLLLGATIVAQSSGLTHLKLIWHGAGRCAGKLTLAVRPTGRGKHAVTIGVARFAIAPGHVDVVAVKLDAAGRSLLRAHHGHLSATLAIVRVTPTPAHTWSNPVHLTLARRSH